MVVLKGLPLVAGVLLVGCATSGPVPEATMAIIGAKKVVVDSIDDRNVRDDNADPSKARFEISPGRHKVEVSLYTGPPDPARPEEAKVTAVCFGAVAGHTYRAQPVVEGGQWHPEIIDEDSGAAVQGQCPEVSEPPGPPPVAEAPPAPAEGDSAPAPAAPAATVPPPTPAPAPATRAPASLPVPVTRAPRTATMPGSGLIASLGFFFGGEDLYKASFTNGPDRSLSAGRGVQLAVGGLWTPLWVDDQVGFGIGASVGWKYDSMSATNGSASLIRFPVSATVHGLFRLNNRWFALLGGGLATEVGGHLSGSGFAAGIDSDLTSTIGLLGEGSLYYGVDRVGLGAGLRYTSLRDHYQGDKVNASSLGIIGFVQYGF
jgi:hypothetical protein